MSSLVALDSEHFIQYQKLSNEAFTSAKSKLLVSRSEQKTFGL